ncbi:MAG: hypothetical protein ACYTFI_19555 [Planctomycetota bacterium]
MRKGALLGAAVGAVLGAIAGLVWCALHPAEDDVAACVIFFALVLALVAAPIGAVVLAIVRPPVVSPRPYSPSVTAQLISFVVNLLVLILLLFVSDAPLPATVLWFSLVAWPINRTISAVRRSRHRRFIVNSHYLVCPRCEYSLANLTTGNCPECGAGLDPDAIQRAWCEIYPEVVPRT